MKQTKLDKPAAHRGKHYFSRYLAYVARWGQTVTRQNGPGRGATPKAARRATGSHGGHDMSVTTTCAHWCETSHNDGQDEPCHDGPVWGATLSVQDDDLDVTVAAGSIETGALRVYLNVEGSANLTSAQRVCVPLSHPACRGDAPFRAHNPLPACGCSGLISRAARCGRPRSAESDTRSCDIRYIRQKQGPKSLSAAAFAVRRWKGHKY